MNAFWVKVKLWFQALFDGCIYSDHWIHQIFEAFTGDTDCPCCIFYRGILIGAVVTFIGTLFLVFIFS